MSLAALLLLLAAATGGAAPGDAPPGKADAGAWAADAFATASRLRRLPLRTPVPAATVSRKTVVAYVRAECRRPAARRVMAASRDSLVALGALEPDRDLGRVMEDFAASQVGGFYDPRTRSLRVADWIPPRDQRPVLVHEATHALQDQAFGIGWVGDATEGLSEPAGAFLALVEGDAMAVMTDAMTGQAAPDPTTDRLMARLARKMGFLTGLLALSEGLPAVIRGSLLFPYLEGHPFVLEARARGGWAAVDALYADPPLTTEQVLHPERGTGPGRDHPREVRLPRAGRALAGMRGRATDVLGELGVRLVLQQALDEEASRAGADGWDGDRFWVLRGAGTDRPALLWVSVWDDEAQAAEAEGALARTKRPPDALARRGDRLAGAWGLPADEARARVAAALDEMTAIEVRTREEWARESWLRQSR